MGVTMTEVVVVKFGGGLITNKAKLCTPALSIIDDLVAVVKRCLQSGLKVVVVHGAGSYGHLRAKYWRLKDGQLADVDFTPQPDCTSQKEAVSLVRKDMLTLNKLILDAFDKIGVSAKSLPPHQWARNTGSGFTGEIKNNFTITEDVAITFGDVVDCDEGEFGILSGDDLVVRLCRDLPNVTRLVFAVKGVDGILSKPPTEATDDDLIREWSPSVTYSGVHNSDVDVTGGIDLKAKRGAEVATLGVEVFLVNGEKSERLFDACVGNDTIGTRIISD